MWTPDSWYSTARAQAEKMSAKLRGHAEFVLRGYMDLLPGMTREQVGELLAGSNAERLNAAPDTMRYPELRGMRDLMAARWRGQIDGAGLDPVQAAVWCDGPFYRHRVIDARQAPRAANCSGVFFLESERGPLLGSNLDSTPGEPIGPPEWPAWSEHLALRSVSSGVFLDELSPEIFPAPVFDLLGRYARTTAEAVDLLERLNFFWGPCNLLIADRAGDVAMIEKSACRIGVRRRSDGVGFITAMSAEHPAMHEYLWDRRRASLEARGLTEPCSDTRYWAVQDQRREAMNRLIEAAKANPSVDAMRAILQYRGDDAIVADNGEVLAPGDPPLEHTLRTSITALREGRSLWWARDNDREIPSWENPQPEHIHDDVLPWT